MSSAKDRIHIFVACAALRQRGAVCDSAMFIRLCVHPKKWWTLHVSKSILVAKEKINNSNNCCLCWHKQKCLLPRPAHILCSHSKECRTWKFFNEVFPFFFFFFNQCSFSWQSGFFQNVSSFGTQEEQTSLDNRTEMWDLCGGLTVDEQLACGTDFIAFNEASTLVRSRIQVLDSGDVQAHLTPMLSLYVNPKMQKTRGSLIRDCPEKSWGPCRHTGVGGTVQVQCQDSVKCSWRDKPKQSFSLSYLQELIMYPCWRITELTRNCLKTASRRCRGRILTCNVKD